MVLTATFFPTESWKPLRVLARGSFPFYGIYKFLSLSLSYTSSLYVCVLCKTVKHFCQFQLYKNLTLKVYKYPGSECIKYGHQNLALPTSSNPAQSCSAATWVSVLSISWIKHSTLAVDVPLYVMLYTTKPEKKTCLFLLVKLIS